MSCRVLIGAILCEYSTLQVFNREAWIEAIKNNSYDKSCPKLIWGPTVSYRYEFKGLFSPINGATTVAWFVLL